MDQTAQTPSANKPIQWSHWLLTLLLLLFAGRVCADSLTVEVDRQNIRLNETLNLSVRYEGRQVASDPDFSVLNQFDILSNHKSTQHSIINGTISAFTEWRLTLAPRNTGQLLIPPLSLRGQHSKAITITVTEPAKDPISGKEDVFLETFVDKSTVFVQEQFIVTYRLHFNQSVDSLDSGQINISQARVEELPRLDFQTTIGNTPYAVAEFRYAVFPDASGVVNIPEQVWTVRTTDQPGMARFGFGGGRFKLHRVRTKPLAITVNPKPDDFPAQAPWLPAHNLTIAEQWSRSPDEFRVGEPITRTITVTAAGVMPEQLPPLIDERGTSALKFYPDKPEQDKSYSSDGVNAKRVESVAIVPSTAGEVRLPEVSVTWWNTELKRVEKATLPARTLMVAPAEGMQTSSTPQAAPVLPDTATVVGGPSSAPQVQTDPRWVWISLALLVCNLLTLAFWWHSRQQPAKTANTSDPEPASLKDALRQLRRACDRADAFAVRTALLEWAKRRWPEQRLLLADIGRLSQDPEAQGELRKLEENLFAGRDHTINYPLLARTAQRMSETSAGKSQAELQPLYKTS